MRHLILYIVTFILAGCVACSRDKAAVARLDSADSLMESRPDSALRILESINRDSITVDATKARYALLMSQALDKNYIDVTSDSLIATATRYYADRPDSPEFMKSLFYQARTYYNDRRFDRAAADGTHAYEIAVKLNDPFWTGKTADLIADIFNETYNKEECINFRKIAVSSYATASNTCFHDWALTNLAIDYINHEQPDGALSIADSLIQNSTSAVHDSAFISQCYNIIFQSYLDKNQPNKAKEYLHKMSQYIDKQLTTINYSDIAIIEIQLGNLSKAKSYIDSAITLQDTTNIQDMLAVGAAKLEFARKTGDINGQSELIEKIFCIQNNEIRKTLKQSAIGAQRDFYNSQLTITLEKEAKIKNSIITAIIISIVVFAVLILFFIIIIKLKNQTLELRINEVALLSAEINRRDNISNNIENNRLRNTIDKLLSERFILINKFFYEYYESGDSPIGKNAIFNRVEKEIKNLSSKKNLSEIESLVNETLDNIIVRFKNEFPELCQDDVTFFMLNVAGLSPRAIGLFMKIKLKTVYTRKTRLKDRILNSKSDHIDEFLSKLQ